MAGPHPPPAAALSAAARSGADRSDVDLTGDGRRLRRDRNRMAVVDALLDLYGESNLRPSTAEIAGRAGLSHRSLFRYFDDFDDLCREAIFRAEQRARPLLPIDADRAAPLADRIDALVTQRLRLFEALGPVAMVSRLNAPFAHVLAAELTKNRAFLRGQLADLFAPELETAPEAGLAEETDVAEGNAGTQDVDGAGASGAAGDSSAGARGWSGGSGGSGGSGNDSSAGGVIAGGGTARTTGAAALAAADVLCSFESFHLLSTDQGLSRPDIRIVLISALTALLDHAAD